MKEAMKQALEAMEYADACLKKQLTTKTKHEYAQDLLMDAGVALRQAIEQAEKPSEGGDCDSPSWCNQYGKCHRKVVGSPTLANCIEQAEKLEPVAWCVTYNGELTGNVFENKRIADLCKRILEAKYGSEEDRKVVAIYAAPQPQREWVGLTDEEREQATGWSVEHIEQALKEKNT